jgi:hypothetical protein
VGSGTARWIAETRGALRLGAATTRRLPGARAGYNRRRSIDHDAEEVHMLKRKSRGKAARPQAQAQPAPPAQPPKPPSAPRQEYATLGADAPIAWPAAGQRRVPVTGQLSPHAAAALQRMGITQDH